MPWSKIALLLFQLSGGTTRHFWVERLPIIMTTPGIHKALRTDAKILHPGAWSDFARHMNSLIDMGRVLEARSLWDSVFEVMHMGVDPSIVTLDVGRPGMLPPIRRIPGTATNCQRCGTGRGGFQFPFVGCWTCRAVAVQEHIVSPQAAWEVFRAVEDRFELLSLHMVVSGSVVEDFIPLHVERLSNRLRLGRDGLRMGHLFAAWRTWQDGHQQWREPAYGFSEEIQSRSDRAQAILRAVLGAAEVDEEIIPEPCVVCQRPCFFERPLCSCHWCDGCRGGLSFAPCVASQTRMSEIFDLWDHRETGSGINGTLGFVAAEVSCTVNAKDHDDSKQLFWIRSFLLVGALAMAGKGGRYALEAAGGALDSEANLILVQAARVREYREKFLLQADEDFAFAFRNISEARSAGGDYLAMEWARVRALEEERFVPQAAAVVEAGPSSSGYNFRRKRRHCAHQAPGSHPDS